VTELYRLSSEAADREAGRQKMWERLYRHAPPDHMLVVSYYSIGRSIASSCGMPQDDLFI